MADGYDVTRRSPSGAPLEIRCRAHEACGWTMQARGPVRDDDPVFRFQFANHLREAAEPEVRVLGHPRRGRMAAGPGGRKGQR